MVPVVETQFEDIFKAALDKHINIALVAFILNPSSITLTVTANAYTDPQYLDQLSMTQTTPTPTASSSHDSDSSDAHLPGSSPKTFLIQAMPLHTLTTRSVCHLTKHTVSLPYAPVTSSFDVGAGVPDHASQAEPDSHIPPPATDVSGGNPPPQHPSAPPCILPPHQLPFRDQ
ncbi:hypothetical protein P692DRAFT_20950748 [Suillus brevipes Sb2]|nr:hypothetical protein P692DRAFT_20950748 [Suillus brevipes Sb2]